MAVKFQPVKIPQSGLSNIPVVNGQLIYCYDTGRVFVDTQLGRLQQGISTVSDSSSLPAVASDKLYFIKKSNKLVSFVNGAWKEVNSQQGTYLPLRGGTMTGGINSSASNVLQVLGKNVISQQKSGQYPAIAGDHVAYAGSQAEKGIVFKGKASVNQNITDGLVVYAPLQEDQTTAQTGQTMVPAASTQGSPNYQTVDGMKCLYFPWHSSMQIKNVTGMSKWFQGSTFSFWMRTWDNKNEPNYIFSIGYTDGSQGYDEGSVGAVYLSGGIMLYGSKLGGIYYTRDTGVYPKQTWFHMCVTTKTNAAGLLQSTMYINGLSVGTATGAPTYKFTVSAEPYTIGLSKGGTWGGPSQGLYMSAVRVYDRVLNEDQITALANQFKTQEVKEDGFLMQFTDSKYSFKPTSDKYDDSDPSNFWTGKAVKSYADSNYLSLKNGGTVTGLLKLKQRPQLTASEPATLTDTTITTKADVTSLIDQKTASYLPIAGGTMTGNITLSNTSMDLTNADTANIAVTGKAVTDYVSKKTANYLPLSGGTVTGALTVNGAAKFASRPSITGSGDVSTNNQLITLQDANSRYLKLTGGTVTGSLGINKTFNVLGKATFAQRPAVLSSALTSTGNDQDLTSFKDLTTYVNNYTTKYLPLDGGTLKSSLNIQNGTDTSLVAQAVRWAYTITADNNQALYSNVGTFYRQHSDSQTIVKYGRGVQLTFGFSDQGTSTGLYLAKYSSKAAVSQTRKGIQIINTGTLYHSQDSTNDWQGFNGDVTINFTNKQNTNSIAQWGPVKDLIFQQKRFLFQDCGAGDVAIGSDDVIYYCQPTNTTTKYTLPTQPDNPNYTHVRRLYVRLWSGYAFSIQGPVTWYQVPNFAPGFTYRLVFQWDRATRKWLGNMFWAPQAISQGE